jgi:hypothetical protein
VLRLLFPRWVLVTGSLSSVYSILGFSRPFCRTDLTGSSVGSGFLHRHLAKTWRRHFDDFSTDWVIVLASFRRPATIQLGYRIQINSQVMSRTHDVSLHHCYTLTNTTVNPQRESVWLNTVYSTSRDEFQISSSDLPASDTMGCMSHFVTWYYNVRMQ